MAPRKLNDREEKLIDEIINENKAQDWQIKRIDEQKRILETMQRNKEINRSGQTQIAEALKELNEQRKLNLKKSADKAQQQSQLRQQQPSKWDAKNKNLERSQKAFDTRKEFQQSPEGKKVSEPKFGDARRQALRNASARQERERTGVKTPQETRWNKRNEKLEESSNLASQRSAGRKAREQMEQEKGRKIKTPQEMRWEEKSKREEKREEYGQSLAESRGPRERAEAQSLFPIVKQKLRQVEYGQSLAESHGPRERAEARSQLPIAKQQIRNFTEKYEDVESLYNIERSKTSWGALKGALGNISKQDSRSGQIRTLQAAIDDFRRTPDQINLDSLKETLEHIKLEVGAERAKYKLGKESGLENLCTKIEKDIGRMEELTARQSRKDKPIG